MASKSNPSPHHPSRKIVSWEEPPPASDARSAYVDILDELKGNPGTWARLDDRASEGAAQAFTSMIRNGKVAGFRGHRLDARHSGPSVWVRYLGEAEVDLRSHNWRT
jgi:hypothetical protein